ncbi:MAG TPA: hypothetical protein VLH19_02520 [Patescibacteria group bacterium]|nr:hypothetical protein [Patescibacteria group bacterium]
MNKSPEIDRRQFLKLSVAEIAILFGLSALPAQAQEQTPSPDVPFVESPYAPTPVVDTAIFDVAAQFGVDTSERPKLFKLEFTADIPIYHLPSSYVGRYDSGKTLAAGTHFFVVADSDNIFDYQGGVYMRIPHDADGGAILLSQDGILTAGITMTGMLESSNRS